VGTFYLAIDKMRWLRAEVQRRMLGNGYCARPVEMDCHFESIWGSCTFFVTTLEFKTTLTKQRDDARAKGRSAGSGSSRGSSSGLSRSGPADAPVLPCPIGRRSL
jgi:hypothetical protein